MGLTIDCECGAVVRGDTEDALLAAARAHIADAHRAAAGVVTQRDLLAMARHTVEPGGSGSRYADDMRQLVASEHPRADR